jgi:hypothetical protein
LRYNKYDSDGETDNKNIFAMAAGYNADTQQPHGPDFL